MATSDRRKRAAAVLNAMAGGRPRCGEKVSHNARCLELFDPYAIVSVITGQVVAVPVICQSCYVKFCEQFNGTYACWIAAGSVRLISRRSRAWRETFPWTIPRPQK